MTRQPPLISAAGETSATPGAPTPVHPTIRKKLMLVVLATTAIALLVAAAALLLTDVRAYERSLSGDLKTQAEIISLSSAAALTLDDQGTAERNLMALRARPPCWPHHCTWSYLTWMPPLLPRLETFAEFIDQAKQLR